MYVAPESKVLAMLANVAATSNASGKDELPEKELD